MLIIIAHHFSAHGEFSFSETSINVNRLWIQFIFIGGAIGNSTFVLLSGYFLVREHRFRTSRAVKLWLQIFTYSILILIIFSVTGIRSIGIRQIIGHSLPIASTQYWFASTYFMLYLLSPYVNRLLQSLTRLAYQQLLALLTFCWCLVPTFTNSIFNYQSSQLLFFIYLYALAGYVRLYASETTISGKTYLLCAGGIILLTFSWVVACDILGINHPVFAQYAFWFYGMGQLPIVMISLFLLLGFAKLDITYRKGINVIASATFGVYLIHDNNYVRPFLWQTVFKNASFSESPLLIPYSIAVVLIVFCGATLIELLRRNLLERNYMPVVDRLADFLDEKKEKLFAREFFRGM